MRQQPNVRLNAGVLITKTFALIAVLACVDVNFVCGLQSSVLADLKQAERASASRISNKVKRAQEVVMFGNQQNKLSDHNYLRPDKRDIASLPVPDIQNALDKDDLEEPVAMPSIDQLAAYPQLFTLRNRYYYDEPDVYDTTFYEDARQKRNVLKKSPVKRSDRIFRSFYDNNSRTKRESQLSQLDPDELLSLLATWEEEQQQQQHRKHPPSWRNIGHNTQSEYEPYSNGYPMNDIDNDDSQENEEWLDAPIPIHHFSVKPRFYPPYNTNIIPNRQARKYKNLPDNEYGRYEQHDLPQRRYML